MLQSLKFIQKDEEDVDEIFYDLRARNYDEYMEDPIGQELIDKAIREGEQHNEFAKRVAFIEDVSARHRYNLGTNMG